MRERATAIHSIDSVVPRTLAIMETSDQEAVRKEIEKFSSRCELFPSHGKLFAG